MNTALDVQFRCSGFQSRFEWAVDQIKKEGLAL